MMELKAVLFDHDGTLVDSEPLHLAIWREVAKEFGAEVSDQQYAELMLGASSSQNAIDIVRLNQLQVEPDVLRQAKVDKTKSFMTRNCFPAIEGASDVLTRCAESFSLALVSGSQRFCVEASLRGHDWSDLFSSVVAGTDVENNKPAPDSYLKALAELNVQADEAIAVEDTETGVTAAVAAGLRVIAISNDSNENHDFSAAEAIVENLAQAGDWIQSRSGR